MNLFCASKTDLGGRIWSAGPAFPYPVATAGICQTSFRPASSNTRNEDPG
jgi:hypothetical protein